MAKIIFLGDLFYHYDMIQKDIDKISDFIKSNDYQCILNLEGSLYPTDQKIKKRGPHLYQSPITIEVLKKLNVIGVCLANNHIMDYGEEGLQKTIQLLDENHIQHCGAGENLEKALQTMCFQLDNKKIEIANYGWDVEETVYATDTQPGCAPKYTQYIINNEKNKEQADVYIQIMHWGFEYNVYPMPVDIELAHNMIDNGTDLIIGHHPHVTQAKEIYHGKHIYYSLGNFYFSDTRHNFLRRKFNGNIPDKCSYGIGVVYDIEKEIVEKEVVVYYDSHTRESVVKMSAEHIEEILPDISNVSYNSKEYYQLVKNNKLNGNPILTGKTVRDKMKLNGLYITYFLKKIIRCCLHMLGIKRKK